MTTDDKTIVAAMHTSLQDGLRLLMGKYKAAVYWHIRRLVVSHDDAQDATQETFVRAYRSFDQLKDGSTLRGWLFRIATNEAMRIIERRRGTLSLDEDDGKAEQIIAGEYVDYSDLESVKLQKAILSLPEKQQIAFNLRYYNELSFAEIAEATHSTEGAVKANFHIAKAKIVNYMNSND